jgi:hypothetical protein
LKEALANAIALYNEKSTGKPIIDITEKYKVRLSKKSGLPDMDLPGNVG